MEDLKVFKEQEVLGRDFKMYGTIEKPLFLANDVANWIEHSNVTVMLKKVDDDEKVKLNNVYFENRTGGNGTMFLTEDGLYEVLMQSRKPIAKQFKKEVKTILNQIRKTGGYIPISESDDEKSILIKAVGIYERTLKEKDNLITTLKPKAECYDVFLDTDGFVSLNKAAKAIGVGRNKMMEFLREQKVLFKDGGDNIPYQRFCNEGKFKINYYTTQDGGIHGLTKVSSAGLDYIRKLLLKQSYSKEIAR